MAPEQIRRLEFELTKIRYLGVEEDWRKIKSL